MSLKPPLQNLNLTETVSYVGTMDYRHLDNNENTYSYRQLQKSLSCGNGTLVEDIVSDYWDNHLTTTFYRSPTPSTHWDFMVEQVQTMSLQSKMVEVELRRIGFKKKDNLYNLFLGYGSGDKRKSCPWYEKAELLKTGNGGYLGAFCEPPYFHMFWYPAQLVLDNHWNVKKDKHGGAYLSELQMVQYFNLNIRDYMIVKKDR